MRTERCTERGAGGYPAGARRRLVEQLLERLHLQQEQAQVEEDVDDLGAGDEIATPETLQRLVDHLGELLCSVHGH